MVCELEGVDIDIIVTFDPPFRRHRLTHCAKAKSYSLYLAWSILTMRISARHHTAPPRRAGKQGDTARQPIFNASKGHSTHA